MRIAREAFYLSIAGRGQRFAILHTPDRDAPKGAIVYVHPFAEEMNKSRRMAALQLRAFAAAGFAVLQLDLLGCGDSSGDFGDATWGDWVDDVAYAARWLVERHVAPLFLWGLRAGCLIATEAATRLDVPVNFVFWQPTVAGKAALQQFLRLKVAGEFANGSGKAAMEALRRQLAAGEPIEVAGYALHPALCNGLEAATLRPPASGPGRIDWLEVSSRVDASPSPAMTTGLDAWSAAGWQARARLVTGPAFWQTVEIEEAPALVDATVELARGLGAPDRTEATARSGAH